MKYKEWSMPSGSPRVRQNLEAAGIPALLAAILAARGITQPDQARRLLTPGAEPVLDPMLLRDMDRAAARDDPHTTSNNSCASMRTRETVCFSPRTCWKSLKKCATE